MDSSNEPEGNLPAARVANDESRPAKAQIAHKSKSIGTRLRRRWRAWLRAIHRDAGYLAVGLTILYAASGLAINHIGSWDPNFSIETETHQISPLDDSIRGDEEAAARAVLAALAISAEPREFFFETEQQLEIFFDEDERTLVVNIDTGSIVESYKSERFLLRAANWLHYNRGKAAWTYIADGYAVFLLFLAFSGIFMLKGRKGFIGRGAILIALGASIPILYVHFSGGP